MQMGHLASRATQACAQAKHAAWPQASTPMLSSAKPMKHTGHSFVLSVRLGVVSLSARSALVVALVTHGAASCCCPGSCAKWHQGFLHGWYRHFARGLMLFARCLLVLVCVLVVNSCSLFSLPAARSNARSKRTCLAACRLHARCRAKAAACWSFCSQLERRKPDNWCLRL